MFGKVKRYFGIEGVKVDLELPEKIKKTDQQIDGKLILASLHSQTVQGLEIKLIEKFVRGRGTEKKIDEYELGAVELTQTILVEANEPVAIEFSLPFALLESEVDVFANRNPINKVIAGLGRRLYNAKSEFFIVAEAKVKGTALPPFKKEKIIFL